MAKTIIDLLRNNKLYKHYKKMSLERIKFYSEVKNARKIRSVNKKSIKNKKIPT